METGEITVAASLAALASAQNCIAHNLANLNTPSFKRNIPRFIEYLTNMQSQFGRSLPIPVYMEGTDFGQGDMSVTGNDLDIAINGKGFFKVKTPWGIRYTRVGSLHPNDKGELCTPSGYVLLGKDDQPIVVGLSEGEGTQILIDPIGTVRTKSGKTLGKIGIYRFENPEKLIPQGDGLYICPSAMKPIPDTKSRIEQGALERSNVDAMKELVVMIINKRNFEAASKALVQVHKSIDSFISVAKQ